MLMRTGCFCSCGEAFPPYNRSGPFVIRQAVCTAPANTLWGTPLPMYGMGRGVAWLRVSENPSWPCRLLPNPSTVRRALVSVITITCAGPHATSATRWRNGSVTTGRMASAMQWSLPSESRA